MAEPVAIDYALTDGQSDALSGAVLLPVDLRREILAKLPKAALVELFAQFIGLANSVVANNREMIELAGIISGEMHPDKAHQINLPTIFGALVGAKLANAAATDKVCAGCAYRLGTPANQSPVTTCDADWCDKGSGYDFMCHEDLDESGNPTHICRGHGRVTAGARHKETANG
jgi:hypothetical protein